FRALGGSRYRYRLERDVFVRGSRRFLNQLAAGGDGVGGARLYRAWDADAAGQREALLRRADVSARTAAERALPAVLSDWRGTAGALRSCSARCGSDRDGAGVFCSRES